MKLQIFGVGILNIMEGIIMIRSFIIVGCFLLLFLPYAHAAIDPNLIMYLPMDEGDGNIVKDASPNGFNGELKQNGFKWIDGVKGKGLELVSGTDIQIPDNAKLDGMKALTLEIWLLQNAHQATDVIIKGATWPGMSYLVQPWSDQQIYFGINDTSSRAIAPAGSYPLNKWYHVAATFDGDTLKLFIDGEEKSSAKSPVKQAPETKESLLVGNLFNGSIDAFVMYDRALTADEIKKDMKGLNLSVNPNVSLSATWGNIKSRF
jgi:hypothetical protein